MLIEEYLHDLPLRAPELQAGEALRLIRCVRVAEKEWAWVFLYFKHGEIGELHPRIRGTFGIPVKQSSCHVCETQECSISGNAWQVKELSFRVPQDQYRFKVNCGKAKCKVGYTLRTKLIAEYYDRTRNAAIDDRYATWLDKHREAAHRTANSTLSIKPLMSIITPAYNTDAQVLQDMLESVLSQTYAHWELILVNASPENESMQSVLAAISDERIKVITLSENQGISGNTKVGIEQAQGEYLSFLDHDDLLEPHALYEFVQAIEASNSEADLLYCDEDSVNELGNNLWPLFKPSLNSDLLYSNNYIIHMLTVSRRIIEQTTRSDDELNGAQDYDLTFKAFEKARRIIRIPQVLYHWRIHSGSLNTNPDSKPYAQLAGEISIENHLERRGISAKVEQAPRACTYETRFLFADAWPRLSCIASAQTLEVLEQSIARYEQCAGATQKVDCIAGFIGSPQARNVAAKKAQGELLLYVSDNIAEVDEDFLVTLAGYFAREEVATVSPRVYRADGLLEYAGISVTPEGKLMHLSRFLLPDDYSYVGRPERPYDSLVGNAEYCMIRKSTLIAGDYFDEGYQSLAYSYADLCLKISDQKKLCVYTPFATVRQECHTSFLSECSAEWEENDRKRFVERHGAFFAEYDPSQNPNFDPRSPYYRLRWE